jgi:hypothetical protein
VQQAQELLEDNQTVEESYTLEDEMTPGNSYEESSEDEDTPEKPIGIAA